jgi:hypothetical protein
MSRLLQTAGIICCNACWFIACMPSCMRFAIAALRPRAVQEKILKRTLRRNRRAQWLRNRLGAGQSRVCAFKALAPIDHSDIDAEIKTIADGKGNMLTEEPVLLLQPTSGSSKATKLIPYTRSLQKQFQAATGPWIACLYMRWPALLRGTHYWSISPSTPVNVPYGPVRIGFDRDTEYLSPLQSRIARFLSPLPPEISRIGDSNTFEYLNCLFLVRDRRLGFISVWHPSFLTCILEVLAKNADLIIADIRNGTISRRTGMDDALYARITRKNRPDPDRAAELAAADIAQPEHWQRIWPNLRVISCWADSGMAAAAAGLGSLFPNASLQPKGLIATEGIVSIPLGSRHRPLAITSHALEFMAVSSDVILQVHQLEKARQYRVVLTNAGGLYRYRLHDIVEVTGFFGAIPCIAFIERDNIVSDLVGEKLNIHHVEEAFRSLQEPSRFIMLAPHFSHGKPGYSVFIEQRQSCDYESVLERVEHGLMENYHYRHARSMRQLNPLSLFVIQSDAYRHYADRLVARGCCKRGDIKHMALRIETDWAAVFEGAFLQPEPCEASGGLSLQPFSGTKGGIG